MVATAPKHPWFGRTLKIVQPATRYDVTQEWQHQWLPWWVWQPMDILRDVRPCGIYFLIKSDRVVYVGQSVDALARVSGHRPTKEFDHAMFLRCPQTFLNCVETWFIWTLRPPHNWHQRPNPGLTCRSTISASAQKWLSTLLQLNIREAVARVESRLP